MQSLIGKNILIGKEPGAGRLMVALEGTKINTAIGPANSVPASVSRCLPEQGIAHARISIDANGQMILTNLKPLNVTYVNGSQVLSKHIESDTAIELGCDRFSVNMAAILATAKRLAAPLPKSDRTVEGVMTRPAGVKTKGETAPPAPAFSTKCLETIWNEYEAELDRIQAKQKRNNTMRALQGVLSLGGMVIGALVAANGTAGVGIVFSAGALILGIVTFFLTKNDTSVEDRKKATDKLEDRYLCPNPQCRKSIPTKPYKWIQRNYTSCSYCKARYI